MEVGGGGEGGGSREKNMAAYLYIMMKELIKQKIELSPYCTQKGQNCIQFWPF